MVMVLFFIEAEDIRIEKKVNSGRAMVGQPDLVGQEGVPVVVRVGRVGYNMVMFLFVIDREVQRQRSM